MKTLSEILVPALSNLSPDDKAELDFILNDIERTNKSVSRWVGADGQPHVHTLHAKYGIFEQQPLSGALYQKTAPQVIAHNTETALTMNTIREDNSWFKIDPADSTKINLKASLPNRRMAIFGIVNFEGNGTGRRAAHLNAYNSAGSLIAGMTMFSMLPSGITTDVYPFALPFPHSLTLVDMHHVKVTVIQTSGGNLSVTYSAFELFLLE